MIKGYHYKLCRHRKENKGRLQKTLHTFNHLDKIDQLLEKHKLPQFIQHERDNWNSIHITIKETEFTI